MSQSDEYLILYDHPRLGALVITCQGQLPAVGEVVEAQQRYGEGARVRWEVRGRVDQVVVQSRVVVVEDVEIVEVQA